jgi:hypothetical protein
LTPRRSLTGVPLAPQDTGEDFAYVEAGPVLALLRSLRPARRWLSRATTIYVSLLSAGILVVLFWGLSRKIASFVLALASPYHVVWGPAALVLLLLAAFRYSTLQGFVSFSEPDCMMLLSAPMPRRGLVWHRLRGAVLFAAFGGAVVGMLAALIADGRTVGAARLAEAAVAGFGVGVVLVAGSWQVQRLGWASKWVLRLTLPAIGLAVLVGLAPHWGGAGRAAVLWSGPWGWPLLPTGGRSLGPDLGGLAIISAFAVAGWLSLSRTAGKCSIESFRIRARTRSEVVAGLYAFDVRPVMIAGRQRWTMRWQRRLRLPAPRKKLLAVPWHTLFGLLRSPLRLGWGVGLGGAGMALLVIQPGRVGLTWLGALALYLAATALLEPLRMEVDASAASQILLPWSRAVTWWRHCLVPAALHVVAGILALVVAYAAGYASGTALVSGLILVIPTSLTAVLAAALSARRGGRVSSNLLFLSAGDTQGFSVFIIVLWVFGWAILGIVAVALFAGRFASQVTLGPRLALGAMVLAVLALGLQRALIAPPREPQLPGRPATR